MIIEGVQTAESGGSRADGGISPLDCADGREDYTFGHFLVSPASRTLTRRGEVVEIGSRAFDLLVVLVRSSGEIVPKNEIVRSVWPSTTVDESNLRFQMTCLRRALGTERDRIKTIPGRGYLFVGQEVRRAAAVAPVVRRNDEDGHASTDRMPAIVIIDEDPVNREALHRLLRPLHAYVQSFVSLEAFFASGSGGHQRELAA